MRRVKKKEFLQEFTAKNDTTTSEFVLNFLRKLMKDQNKNV